MDGEVIDCGHTQVMAVLTPGHTKGHLSYYFPNEDFLFTGDICLTRVGPWYGDFDTTIDDFINAVDRIIELKPKMLVTAHVRNFVTEDIRAKLIKYRDRIFKREERILDFLTRKAANIHEIADERLIYRLHSSSFVLFWEKCMILQHLKRLSHRGMVEKAEDGRYSARFGTDGKSIFCGDSK